MANRTAPLLPVTENLLRQFGDRLRLARLRRRLTAKQVAERAGMAPMTLRSIERGGAGVTMAAYLAVMQVLGFEEDLDLLGKADPLGRELQDAQLLSRPDATRAMASGPAAPTRRRAATRTAAPRSVSPKAPKPSSDPPGWIGKSKFASAEALSSFIDLPAARKKAR